MVICIKVFREHSVDVLETSDELVFIRRKISELVDTNRIASGYFIMRSDQVKVALENSKSCIIFFLGEKVPVVLGQEGAEGLNILSTY
jgi:hypothetical protein